MRLLSRLEAKQKSGAIRYILFRQSPKDFIQVSQVNPGAAFLFYPLTSTFQSTNATNECYMPGIELR
jgi:hypothetical protein